MACLDMANKVLISNLKIERAKSSDNEDISPLEVSVIVPVMNEAGNISLLIEELVKTFSGRSFEIIYVDDASTDATADELMDSLEKVPELRVLRHANRAGQSAAIRTGLLVARGSLIGVIDGDGQNVPADFKSLEAALIRAEKSGQIVMSAGIRKSRNDSLLRLAASICAKWVRISLLSDSHPDSGCGIKMLRRSLFRNLPFFNHMHRFMPSLVRRHGGIVIGIPVRHRPRTSGQSKYRIIDRLIVGLSDIFGVMWLLRRGPAQGDVEEIEPIRRGKKKKKYKNF